MSNVPTPNDLRDLKVSRKGRYQVGEKLGEGAQGVVFKLVDTQTGRDDEWAVKITKNPKPTKGRRSRDELNAKLLFHERTLYHASLIALRGKIIPNVPDEMGKLHQYGEDEQAGWNFLVIEQMDMLLSQALEKLPRKRNSVELGPVCQRLLYIVQEIHNNGYLITDVKPENFMVAKPTKKGGSLVDHIRLIDLPLLQSFRHHPQGHAPNDGIKGVRGTPLYASRNIHQLETPSRRDDIESILYVLGEYVIQVNATVTGKTAEYKQNGSFLPWAGEASDKAVGDKKEAQVSDRNSEYYSRMPPEAAQKLFDCWEEVSAYKYKKEPDYKMFRDTLSGLRVPVPMKTTKKKAPPTKKAPPKRAAAGLPSPPRSRSARAAAGPPRRAAAAAATIDISSDDDAMEVDEVWGGAEENVPTKNEQLPLEAAKANRSFQAALLIATDGPYEGAKWVIQEGVDEKIIIGSNPSKRGHKALCLSQDAKVCENHARLQLVQDAANLKILVFDNKSESGTFVGKTRVKTNHAAFNGDVICVGDTKLLVRRVAPPKNGAGA